MKNIHIKMTFTENILGTCNSNSEIHREFIASKAPDAQSREEEVAALGVDEVEQKSTTVFARDEDGTPILWNYQIKGFFKESCYMLRGMPGEDCSRESCKLKAYKKVIDGTIEPSGDGDVDRKIRLHIPDGWQISTNQRPLRGQTAQGERIALASSEELPSGTWCELWIRCPDDREKAVLEWLNFGRYHGVCQWRNAGYGRFTYEVLA